MSRLSFRPRPLDFHKKLPVVKSVKDFEDDETPTSTRNAQILRLASEAENEVPQVPSKKLAAEIPTPQYVVVDTYEIDYSCDFAQPTSYIRARGARAEVGDFMEYDLDNDDEDWLQEFNRERNQNLTPETLEVILFKLEVSDHKARERAGVITPTLGPPVPVYLTLDASFEALQSLSIQYGVFQSSYNYWREKRERWQKPILRRLQPPPPVNDTNPYNVFRPRERPNRLHTRRMQRRENNVQSFEKLRQVRRNLEQAKTILEALVKREEKKRDVMESEVGLQRIQMKYKKLRNGACLGGGKLILENETELLEDSLAFTGLPSFPSKVFSSEEEFVDSDDVANSCPRMRSTAVQHPPFADSKRGITSAGSTRRELKRPTGWLNQLDPDEPVMLFTKPLDPEKLAAAGITPPPASLEPNGDPSPVPCRGRFGRGGRLVFDRSDPLMLSPPDCGETCYVPPKPRQSVNH